MSSHDAAYVGRQINKTTNWVKRNARRLPHSKSGRTYFWTDEDIRALLDELRVRPNGVEPQAGQQIRPLTGRRAS